LVSESKVLLITWSLVRSQPGQPFNTEGQVTKSEGVTPSLQGNSNEADKAGAYLDYASSQESGPPLEGKPWRNIRGSLPHNWSVPALRSRPIAIKPVCLPTGKMTYRVTGTICKHQRKIFTTDQEEALGIQAAWELERTLSAAAIRPKATRLKQEELSQAEAAFEMLRGTGLTIVDAVRHLLRNPPANRTEKTFEDAYKAFLRDREGHISARQLDNLKSALSRLATFLGAVGLPSEFQSALPTGTES